MQRNAIVVLLVALLTLPATACETGPTSTPAVSPTPSVTPGPAALTGTPTVPLTASPTASPTAVVGPIDLGVPAGDAYSPQAMAVDATRGLVYVVSGYGDAARSKDKSVMSVVDVVRGEVQETVALPHPFRGNTSAALAPAGDRLFIAGGDDNVLMVVATGVGNEPPGNVLSTQADVRAFALDPASRRLYTVGADQIRTFDVNTLKELQRVAAPASLPVPPAQVFAAVSGPTSRLYVGSPNSDIVTAHRTDDLRKVADILPGGQPIDIIANPGSPQVYLMLRNWPEGITQVAVIEGNEVSQVWQPQAGFDIRGLVPHDVPHQVYLWEVTGSGESRLHTVDPVSGQTLATTALPTQSITKALIRTGRLYLLTWNDLLISLAVESGRVESTVPLGVTLLNAAVDQGGGRLFVIDSGGTVHVLDTASLQQVDTWSRVIGTGTEYIYAAPLSIAGEHLFVPDYNADETAVLDVATGERVATIPKAGQVTLDPARNRLFVSNQGVFIADPQTHAVIDSIEDTVRKTLFSGEPSAIAAEYDAKHDLLFVTMTNNTPGSSSRSWLLVYDGETLQRLDTDIKTDQQFLSGLAIDTTTDRVYVGSSFPGRDVAVFTIRGQLLTRFQYLSGQLFLDEARDCLYVTGWDGLVTLDTVTNDVIDYRRLSPEYSQFTVFDVTHARFYRTQSNTADLLIFSSGALKLTTQTVGQLPPEQIRYLAVADDGTVFAVNDSRAVYRQRSGGWELVSEMLPPIAWPAIHPAPGAPTVVFAYSKQPGEAFGLFRSLDGGRTWGPAVRGLKDFDVRDLALSPEFAADQTAFLLSGEDGVFRSLDGGDSWQRVSDVTGQYIALASTAPAPVTFLVLARNPDVYDETRVYAPAGATGDAEQIGTIGAALYGNDALALSPNFAQDGTAIAGLGQAGLFLSQDSGRTWHPLPPHPEAFSVVYTIHFSLDFAVDQTVYALLAPSYFGPEDRSVLYRSTDGGQNWQRATNAAPLISALAMGPDGGMWAGNTQGHVRSLDPTQLTWEIARPPTPTPVPTPLEPPAGFYRPEGTFAGLWTTDPEVHQALGWAVDQRPRQISTAFQPFEGGAMIWRSDTRTIYALYDDAAWDGFDDTWTPDEPEWDPDIHPPPGREQPVRGFGKVWREQPGVRDKLGWALQPEEGYTSSVQSFERGAVISVGPSVYVLAHVAGEPATWLTR